MSILDLFFVCRVVELFFLLRIIILKDIINENIIYCILLMVG